MAYSQTRYPDVPGDFPPPPLWLLWTADVNHTYDPVTKAYDTTLKEGGKGQVRHHPTIAKCKKAVTGWASKDWGDGKWRTTWRIYEWVDNKYVLRFGGNLGEEKSTNLLFAKRLTKADRIEPIQDPDAEELEAVLASIRQAGQTVQMVRAAATSVDQ